MQERLKTVGIWWTFGLGGVRVESATPTVCRRGSGCSSTELSSECKCPRLHAWPSCCKSSCSQPAKLHHHHQLKQAFLCFHTQTDHDFKYLLKSIPIICWTKHPCKSYPLGLYAFYFKHVLQPRNRKWVNIPETRIERIFFCKFTTVKTDKGEVRVLANGQTKTTAHCLVSGVLKLFWVTNSNKKK